MSSEKPKSKRLRTFLICFAVPLTVTACCMQFFYKTSNIYLIVGERVCLPLTFVVLVIYDIVTKDKRSTISAFIAGMWIIITAMDVSSDIRKYNKQVCNASFGKEFNQQRRHLGIATIPQDWYIATNVGSGICWTAKDSVRFGHESKCVFTNDSCQDESETDNYILKPFHGEARSLSIRIILVNSEYANSNSYTCSDGRNSWDITKNEADSILKVQKIQRD